MPRAQQAAVGDVVLQVQTALAQLGYNPGPVDGVLGQRTMAAIRAYETDHHLEVTGQPSMALLQRLIRP